METPDNGFAPLPECGGCEAGLGACEFLLPTLDGRGCLALSHLGRFLVKFAPVHLGQDARLFTGALEAPQGDVEGFIVSHSY